MSSRLVAVAFEAHDPDGMARFWGELLGREVVRDTGGALLPALDTQVGVRFVPAAAVTSGAARLHLHLTTTSVVDR